MLLIMNNETAALITVSDGVAAINEFFCRMSRYCAALDFDSTEALFAANVISFGTKATVVQGLTSLRKNQWEKIWPNIEQFEMQIDSAQASATGDLAWGVVPWTSTGFDQTGNPYDRPGRATAVLSRSDGIWRCVHTHFSLAPGTPQRSFGKIR